MFFSQKNDIIINNNKVYWYKHLFINIFSKTGAHIGHSFRNSIRQSAWIIYGFKWDLAIIDLTITVSSIKSSFVLASMCVSKHRPFWFATQDKTFYRYSRYLATKCGEFSSTLYWIRGMASNFESITFSYFIRKPKFVYMRKDFLFDLNFNDWFFTRLSWPGGLLLSSIFFSYFVCRDSFRGKIGCVGLLDTNADSKSCVLAVPSNDDSIDWLVFINDVFSEYILVKKLWAVLRWNFFLIKKSDNFFVFEKWLSKFLRNDLVFNKMLFSKSFNNFNIFYFPLWYISNLNINFSSFMEKLTVYYKSLNVSFSKKVLYDFFQNSLIKKKLFLVFSSVSFYGRVFFFSDDIVHNGLTFFNFETISQYRYRYVYSSNWKLKHKFKSFSKRFLRNNSFFVSYINNISFFLLFGVKTLYQKFVFFFSVGSFNKINWWEFFFLSNKIWFFFFSWFFRLRMTSLNKIFRLKEERFSGFFSKRVFSFWDPIKSNGFLQKKPLFRNFIFDSNNIYSQIKDINSNTINTNINSNLFFYNRKKIYI